MKYFTACLAILSILSQASADQGKKIADVNFYEGEECNGKRAIVLSLYENGDNLNVKKDQLQSVEIVFSGELSYSATMGLTSGGYAENLKSNLTETTCAFIPGQFDDQKVNGVYVYAEQPASNGNKA